MARIITKELALKMVDKLKAKPSASQRKGSPHDLYDVVLEGVLVGQISIRRSSIKDIGHDHVPEEIHLSTGKAKRLGQCPLTVAQYIEILKENGHLPTAENIAPTTTATDEQTMEKLMDQMTAEESSEEKDNS